MKCLFAGRKQAGAKTLGWLLANGIDILAVVDSQARNCEVRAAAHAHGIHVVSLEAAQEAAADGVLKFDLGISMLFHRLVKNPLLAAPDFGFINFHPAPLPEYKGTAGYNVAIMEALDRWSVSAHYMDESIDTGAIIDVFTFSIDPGDETARSLERKCQQFLFALAKKTVRRVIELGRLEATKNEGGRYISRSEMEHMKKIVPGDDVERKVRAFWFPPYTGAYVELDGEKYTLVSQKILDELAPDS